MKSIKLLINKIGFEKLKVLMEDWYLTECIVNNSSEVDDVNIINKPTLLERLHDLILYKKDNLKDYEVDFLELSLRELKENKNIPYCYILTNDNKIFSIVENKLSYERIEELQNENINMELE